MARKKKKHDDDEPEADAMAAEGQPPEGEADEGDQPVETEPAETPADDEVGAEEEDDRQPAARRKGPKVYTLEVRRNESDWAPVAHNTMALHPDQRDLQQVPVGYTKAQTVQVREDWVRAGYEVRLVEVGTEPEPEQEPEGEPEPVVEE